MIRQLTQRRAGKYIALTLMMGMTSGGSPSIAAAAFSSATTAPVVLAESENGKGPIASRAGFVEILDSKGKVKSLISVVNPFEPGQTTPDRPSPSDIEQMRNQLLTFRDSSDPTVAGMASKAFKWLSILNAKNASERHERIRQLPVTIIRSVPLDGRQGVLTSFVVRGQTRVRWFAPNVTNEHTATPPQDEPLSDAGPSASESATGWKEDCFYEGSPSPCATEQEIEDALILAAEAEAESADLDSQAQADWAEIEAYCSQFSCGEDPERRLGGPRAFTTNPCSSEFDNFVAAALTTNGATIALVSMALAPATPALLLAAGVLAVVGGLYWMRSGGTALYNCKVAHVY